MKQIHVGIAGWNNPPEQRIKRQVGQSHLAYYAKHFDCVEINTSFYRPHRNHTYERWRDATPESFRFAVKMPRSITHECALHGARGEIARFFAGIEGLRPKLAVILVQLPPSLQFDARSVRAFFKSVPRLPGTHLVCEPRHISWFSKSADAALRQAMVSRVAVDPARNEGASLPGGDHQLAYFRWHGSPKMYYSSYRADQLRSLAATIDDCRSPETWCMFDNTARYAAWVNALSIQRTFSRRRRMRLSRSPSPCSSASQ